MSTGTKKKKLETLIIKGVSTLSFFSASSEIVTRGTGGPGQIPVTTSQKTDIDGARQTFSSLWSDCAGGCRIIPDQTSIDYRLIFPRARTRQIKSGPNLFYGMPTCIFQYKTRPANP